jgi:hypothetical protein
MAGDGLAIVEGDGMGEGTFSPGLGDGTAAAGFGLGWAVDAAADGVGDGV